MAIPGMRINPVGLLVIGALVVLGVWYIFGNTAVKTQDPLYTVDLRQLLALGIQLVELAGAEVEKVKSSQDLRIVEKGLTVQGAKEFITHGDSASQAVIMSRFKSTFPGLKIISEEVGGDTLADTFLPDVPLNAEVERLSPHFVLAEDVTIWVDPLDATQEYTESKGPKDMHKYVTVMICVAVKGVPIIGILRRPLDNDEYGPETVWGWKGQGFSANLKPATELVENSKLVLLTSRSHAGNVSKIAKQAFGADTDIIPAGGSGYKVLQVCRGKASAYVHITQIKKWDICAGNAVVSAAGGAMTTLKGEAIDYSFSSDHVVSDGLLVSLQNHQKLIERWSDMRKAQENNT